MNQEVTHKLVLTAALILGFASPMCVARNQQGPETPFDPIEPTEKEARPPPPAHFSAGINTAALHGLAPAAMEVSTGTNHLGFRTVRSLALGAALLKKNEIR
jgi:hypothetical protein